jgi:hypothetical protein
MSVSSSWFTEVHTILKYPSTNDLGNSLVAPKSINVVFWVPTLYRKLPEFGSVITKIVVEISSATYRDNQDDRH